MPVYRCGCEAQAPPVTTTVALLNCAAATITTLAYPMALPDGPIVTSTAALLAAVEASLGADYTVALNVDGYRLDITHPATAPVPGNITPWPVTVAPVKDGATTLCPITFPVTLDADGQSYASLPLLAQGLAATFAYSNVTQAADNGCDVWIAAPCANTPPADVQVSTGPVLVTTTVLVTTDGTNSLCPTVPFPALYQGSTVNNISELASAVSAQLGAAYSVAPNADGCRLDITYATGNAVPGNVTIATNKTVIIPVVSQRNGDTLCPLPLPATLAENGQTYSSLATLVTAWDALRPGTWSAAVNADGCRVDVTLPVSDASPTSIVVSHAQCVPVRFRSRSDGSSSQLYASVPSTDPRGFAGAVSSSGVTLAGSSSGFASAFASGVASKLTVTFDATVPGGQSFYVGLRDQNLTLLPIDAVSGPATIEPGPGTGYPRVKVTGSGAVSIEFNTTANPVRDTDDLSLAFASLDASTSIRNLTAVCSGNGQIATNGVYFTDWFSEARDPNDGWTSTGTAIPLPDSDPYGAQQLATDGNTAPTSMPGYGWVSLIVGRPRKDSDGSVPASASRFEVDLTVIGAQYSGSPVYIVLRAGTEHLPILSRTANVFGGIETYAQGYGGAGTIVWNTAGKSLSELNLVVINLQSTNDLSISNPRLIP